MLYIQSTEIYFLFLGWNSMLMALNESSMIENVCDGTSAMKEFFSDICIIDHQSSDPVRGCFKTSGIGYEPMFLFSPSFDFTL